MDTIRFPNLMSEIALAADGQARPLHILRPGTFTDMNGREFTFTADHIQQIVQSFGGRKKPPITENHDFGRAIGRITRLWSDADGNLYAQPTWNKFGRDLLSEGVYDGFSSELYRDDDQGLTLIGGSLTNYPAVDGLEPVSLSAPTVVIDRAPGSEALVQEADMPDEAQTSVETSAAPPPPETAAAALIQQQLAQLNLSGDMARNITEMVRSSVMAQFEQVKLQAEQQARAEIARFQREQEIVQLAQHMTTPTLQRQHALPFEAERLGKFLNSLSDAQRSEARALFDHILASGLVSFEEIGSGNAGDSRTDHEAVIARVESIKADKMAGGMSASAALNAAIVAVGKAEYNAARAATKGGR